jgi:hypothetical protein
MADAPSPVAVDAQLTVRNNPVLISVRARVPWRISTLCLVLSRFHGQRARLDHLHLITWSLETRGTRDLLSVWLSGRRPMDGATARVDPSLPTTVALAVGEGLVGVQSNGKVHLTAQGRQLAQEIDESEKLMAVEKEFLRQIAPLNETRLSSTLGALAS